MIFFKNTRLAIGKFLFKRRLKHVSRERLVQGLSSCNSIFLVSNLKDDENGAHLIKLQAELKRMNKEVFSVIYDKQMKKDKRFHSTEIQAINHDDLNYFFIPNSATIKTLMERPFDLLIDLSLRSDFPSKYIYAMSKAKLKVGAALNYKSEYGDIVIDISKEQTQTYLIAQLKHYLSNLNNQNQNVA